MTSATSRQRTYPVTVSEIHENVDLHVIHITEDKLRLICTDHLGTMHMKEGWIAPLGLVVSIGATFLTAKFETTLGLDAAFWSALFAVAFLGSAGWLIVSVRRAWVASSVDTFIEKVKNTSPSG